MTKISSDISLPDISNFMKKITSNLRKSTCQMLDLGTRKTEFASWTKKTLYALHLTIYSALLHH